ncbi:MAG: tyrosine-type recombinase/integrase [Campylobacterota bacterium]|nr:tyrosine-type recombinase/integrase [Campylobacterota bacterium]
MMRSLQDVKKYFLAYLGDIRAYSDLTLKSYDETLNEMFFHSEITYDNDEFSIELMPYRLHIASQKAKTISRKLSSIRSFVHYLRRQDIKVSLHSDESIKVPKTLPKPISHEHIKEALREATLQERCAVLMLYTLGLRISELASLHVEQIQESWVRVLGKGNKQREVPLVSQIAELIREYRGQYQPSVYLFERDGAKLSENSLRYIITKVFKNVGMKVTPHQLRHSYATELLNHNARIADVSELLGHASMATTQIYTKLGSVLKMENYLKSHPLCKDSLETNEST